MTLSWRQARKQRPDLLDRAIDAFMAEGDENLSKRFRVTLAEIDPKLYEQVHDQIREEYRRVRYHLDRLGKEEREASRKAHSEAMARRARESL